MVKYSTENSIDLVLAQDPYIHNGIFSGLPQGWSVHYSTNKTATIVVIRKNIFAIKSFESNNSVFVNIQIDNSTIHFGSNYSSPSSDLEEDLHSWQDFFENPNNIFLAGDFNAKLRPLGYTHTDDRGHLILDFLNNTNFLLLNDPQGPKTYSYLGREGNPDLTFCSPTKFHLLKTWMVDDTTDSLSDHRYINISLELPLTQHLISRYNTKHTNFYKFNKLFKNYNSNLIKTLKEITKQTELDSWIIDLNQIIDFISQIAFRKKQLNLTPKYQWWTIDLKIQRNKISALLKRYKRTKELTDLINYKKHRAAYKKAIQTQKVKSWRKFCSETRDKFGTLYKIIGNKTLNNTDLIHSTLLNTHHDSNYQDTFNHLIKHHFKLEPPNIQMEQEPTASSTFPPITIQEILEASHSLNGKKAPGHDNQDPRLIKNLCNHYPTLIQSMLNTCLRLSHFPTPWKISDVIFFHKNGRNSKDPKSYRPISLLPAISKIFEKIIKFRLNHELETKNIINNKQYGFREGRGTTDLLYDFLKTVKDQKEKHKYVASVSLDIVGAFDGLEWHQIKMELSQLSISNYLKNILFSFLKDRIIKSKFGQTTQSKKIYKGCPQGSCLGPLLWTIIANRVIINYLMHYSEIWAFADDFMLIAAADSRRSLESNINSRLLTINQVLNNLQLTLSENKTIAMVFGKNNLTRRPPIFKLNSTNIKVANTHKYLGIIIDNKLNWIPHLNYLKEKISLFTANINKVRGVHWGTSRELLRVWYEVITQKQIEYASEIWSPSLNAHGFRKLSALQRSAVLSFINAYKTTSTDAVLVLSGIPPIHLQLQRLHKIFKLKKTEETISINDIHYQNKTLEKSPPTHATNTTILTKNIHFPPTKNNYELKDNKEIKIFTDGSKQEDQTAYSYIVFEGKRVIYSKNERLKNDNSVYQAELKAILEAITWTIEHNIPKIKLFTDSLSAVAALQNLFPKTDLIHLIKQRMILTPGTHFHLHWVKGHIGIEGNEAADRLAKEATFFDHSTDLIGTPLTRIKYLLSSLLMDHWQSSWDNSDKGRHTYSLIPKVGRDLWCGDNCIIYFLSGHGSFPTYLFKIGKKNNNKCFCGAVGDPLHYIFDTCTIMPHSLRKNNSISLNNNIKLILKNKTLVKKLKENYNKLNSFYSFIRYTF